jgi:hypothetical protein
MRLSACPNKGLGAFLTPSKTTPDGPRDGRRKGPECGPLGCLAVAAQPEIAWPVPPLSTENEEST